MKKTRTLFTVLMIFALTLVLASCDIIFGNFTVPPTDSGLGCEHVWTDATCKTASVCEKCGTNGAKASHRYESELVDPTCEAKGYTEHTCSVCGDTYIDSYKDMLEHTASDWIFNMESGENAAGEKYKECTVCGKVLEREEIQSHTHTFVSVEAKLPTCTDEGHSAYEYCSDCGYKSKYSVIAAVGHNYGEWVSNGTNTHTAVCENDPAHTKTEFCTGLQNGDFICSECGSEYEVEVNRGSSAYGYSALASYDKGAAMQELYNQLAEVCEAFAISDENVVPDENGYYIIGTLEFETLSLTSDEARSVWKVFCYDNPLYYWISSVSLVSSRELYLVISEDYSEAEYRRECDSAILAFTNECVDFIGSGKSELEIAMAISAYIAQNMEYAYDEYGNPAEAAWAHNMIGFALYDYGVCESYAKTFMYLCLMNDVDCIMGAGWGGDEKHAWNYVQIDGVWYGADITWTDNLGEVAVYDEFGVSDTVFHADHVLSSSTEFGIEFTYAIPEVSDTSLELCELYKNGEKVGIFTSVESAVASMTDPNAEYELNIGGFYSTYVGAPVHTLDTATLPEVKLLTVVGMNYPAEPGYMDKNSPLVITADTLTATSELVFKNVEVKGTLLSVTGADLTLAGDTVYLDIALHVSKEGSTVTVLTEDTTYFAQYTEIYKLDSGEHKVVFSSVAIIEYLKGNAIYQGAGADITVKNYV